VVEEVVLGKVGGLEVEHDRHVGADAGHVHRRG
jgi:hypothetical protein